NGVIEPISTRGVIRRPEYCPRPHEDASVKFNRTHALPGSPVQVVVLPDKSVLDEYAVCHVRVWDERLLAQNEDRQNLLYVDAYEKRFKQNSDGVTSQQVLSGQFYDFHTFGFSLGAMPTDSYGGCDVQRNRKELPEQVVRARTDNWHTDHVLYEVGTPEVLQNLTADEATLNWGLRLASFKTYPGRLNNSMVYAETGLVSDPKLNILVYRALNHLERSPSARAPSMTVILRSELDGLFREFNATYPVSDCHSSNSNQTLDEMKLSFLSQWYIALKESSYEPSYRELLDRNIEATTHHLATCLALFAHREYSQTSGRLERFRTSSLANLAYALSLIEPNLDSLTKILDIVLRRQIRTRSTVDTSEQEVHWEDENSAENPVEITYHAYMALFNTRKNLTDLVPIIRWQLKHLSVFGTVSDPIDSYFIGLQLFTFMRHLGTLNPKKSQSSYEIRPAQEDNFSVSLMGAFNGSPMNFTQGILTLLDGPSDLLHGLNFTVAPRVPSVGCFVATVTQISCRLSELPENSSTDGITLSIEKLERNVNNPPGAQVAVCLNSSLNESLHLTVRGQTGWELQSIPESAFVSTSVVNDTEGKVVRFVLATEQYAGCLEFLYTQTATMRFAHPMKVIAESSTPVGSRKTEAFYLLPTSDNPSDIRPSFIQSHRWTSKQDCRNFSIRPFEYWNAMRNFSGDVKAICKA
ncbi:hypothetical protein X801_08299, partial [Opisthorchis viverrini]